jgi:hypothetical protein
MRRDAMRSRLRVGHTLTESFQAVFLHEAGLARLGIGVWISFMALCSVRGHDIA